MLGLAGVPSVIQFFGFFFLPESPRWLISKGRHTQARSALERIRETQDVADELNLIQQSVNEMSEENKYSKNDRIR